jgi:predicted permease
MLRHDLRSALRLLARQPGFSLVIVVTLALGIGANTAIFAAVDALFLRSAPVADADRLVAVYGTSERDAQAGGMFQGFLPVSYPNFEDMRERAASFETMYAYSPWPMSLGGDPEPVRVTGMVVSASYFEALGVRPLLGRSFRPEEDTGEGAHPVVVLAHHLWQHRFGGDTAILGRAIRLNGRDVTVIGVAPAGFRGTDAIYGVDLWAPMTMFSALSPWGPFVQNRGAPMFFVGGRLGPGAGVAGARAELEAIGHHLADEHPGANRGRGLQVLTLTETTLNPNQRDFFVRSGTLLMGLAGVVLLIACFNVANLLLVRAAARRREMAIRTSIGAGRHRLVAQLLTETLVLFVAGGIVGAAIGVWGHDLLWRLRPPFLGDDPLPVHTDWRVIVVAMLVTLACGIACGLVPALRASRTSAATDLKDSAPGGADGRRLFGLRNALVIGQVALSLVALVGAGLFVRSLAEARAIDPGFEAEGLGLMTLTPAMDGYGEEAGRALYRRILEEVGALPGIEAASLSQLDPLGFGPLLGIHGEDDPEGHDRTLVRVNAVAGDHFRVLEIPVVDGRGLAPSDREGAPRVAVVNEALARTFWPDRPAVGQRFRIVVDDEWYEVVGVVPTGKYVTLGEDPQPALFIPLFQRYEGTVVVNVRAAGPVAPALAASREAIRALAPHLGVHDVRPATALLHQALWAARTGAALLGLFGLLALGLACLGLYAVMATSVRERTREIGVRIALGADTASVLRLVMGRALQLAAIGTAGGVLGALALGRTAEGLLYGISAADVPTIAGVSATLLLVALLASYLPARQATRVDPLTALKVD